jgi:cytochrome c5
MRHPLTTTSAAVLLLAVSGIAAAQLPGGSRRGQMLYENHCSACHTTEVHWRDKKLARDWDGLILQVRVWQGNGKLNWNETDIQDVAQHLNAVYYRFPPSGSY